MIFCGWQPAPLGNRKAMLTEHQVSRKKKYLRTNHSSVVAESSFELLIKPHLSE